MSDNDKSFGILTKITPLQVTYEYLYVSNYPIVTFITAQIRPLTKGQSSE